MTSRKIDGEGGEVHTAIAAGDVELTRALIAAGANVNAQGKLQVTPLHWAALRGSAEICSLLLDAGANPDAGDFVGTLPLHYAASSRHPDAVAVISTAMKDVDIKEDNGRTGLHVAAVVGDVESCKILLRAGADLSAVDEDGEMPMHKAIKAQSLPLVQLFEETLPGHCSVAAGVGRSPLESAVKNGEPELVKFFVLECGADLGLVTSDGGSLSDVADDDEEMQELLRSLATELSIRGSLDTTSGGALGSRARHQPSL
jgi:ankyrin repeat protein